MLSFYSIPENKSNKFDSFSKKTKKWEDENNPQKREFYS